MTLAELPLRHSGKIRDLYDLPNGNVLFVASDRISAFDFILETPIPDKGEILTRLSSWWVQQFDDIVPHHVISTIVPEEVTGRAVVVERLDMFPIECVVRGYLAGSGFAEYQQLQQICGVGLPPGLQQGSLLPKNIFTPATKAAVGDHDENITFDEAVITIGQEEAQELRRISLAVFKRAQEIAADAGLILADTKFEFGARMDGTIVLADEVLTPDSSRFWEANQWQPGQSQPSFDKQYVRDWLLSSGWDPHGDQAPPPLPDDVVAQTREKYVAAFERLTGKRFTPVRGLES